MFKYSRTIRASVHHKCSFFSGKWLNGFDCFKYLFVLARRLLLQTVQFRIGGDNIRTAYSHSCYIYYRISITCFLCAAIMDSRLSFKFPRIFLADLRHIHQHIIAFFKVILLRLYMTLHKLSAQIPFLQVPA